MATNIFAIRWDGNYSRAPDSGGFFAVGRYTERSLSRKKFQGRAPLHSTIVDDFQIRYNATVASLENEVALAASADINWAFLMYGRSSSPGYNYTPGNMEAFDLYQQASNKALTPWCAMTQPCLLGSVVIGGSFNTDTLNEYVGYFGQAHYKKIGGRPVLMILADQVSSNICHTNNAGFAARLNAIASASVSEGNGDPYIVYVALGGATQTAVDAAVAIGADCVSDYFSLPFPQSKNATYASLRTANEARWTDMQARAAIAGIHMAPVVMTGWDPSARRELPNPGISSQPFERRSLIFAAPTPAELAGSVQAALDFCAAHPTTCPHDMVMIYAWSEYDEAGTVLAPTIGNPTATHLAAVAAVTNP